MFAGVGVAEGGEVVGAVHGFLFIVFETVVLFFILVEDANCEVD